MVRLAEQKTGFVFIPKLQKAQTVRNSRISENIGISRRQTRSSKSSRRPPPKVAVAASSPKVQSIQKCGSVSEANHDAFYDEPTPSELSAQKYATPKWLQLDQSVLLDANKMESSRTVIKTRAVIIGSGAGVGCV